MNTTHSKTIAAFIAIGALGVASPLAAKWKAQGEHSVFFHCSGPAGLAFDAKGKDVRVNDSGEAIDVVVGVSDFDSGISLRDKHMKEKYLDAPKFPTATLHVEKSKLTFPKDGKKVSAEAEGKLTLHGVTHGVRFSYSAEGTDKAAQVTGSMKINMKEFGVEVPSYLGVTVKPGVDIRVKFDAKDL
jgi:polyisoprenoid-binding protein YceI